MFRPHAPAILSTQDDLRYLLLLEAELIQGLQRGWKNWENRKIQ
jgi:hypothetical protein